MAVFHVGQKVVSLKSEWNFVTGDPNKVAPTPVKGHVYTVSEIEDYEGDCYLGLEGFGTDVFMSDFFRPIAARLTSIEIFTAMLNKPSVKVPA